MTTKNPPPLLSVRSAVILTASVGVGVGAAVLAAMAGVAVPDAVASGVGSFGGSIALLNSVVAR